ncbi:protein PFF0380w isoform X1 [Patella vulgata]|uniref:protein PFF0380w isoform X1 n=1 Tax=Patella vulgata TaxID=6465 RepID=UPI00218035D0|nr:protein PFF0380w isoform X1 [Patella vulgata]
MDKLKEEYNNYQQIIKEHEQNQNLPDENVAFKRALEKTNSPNDSENNATHVETMESCVEELKSIGHLKNVDLAKLCDHLFTDGYLDAIDKSEVIESKTSVDTIDRLMKILKTKDRNQNGEAYIIIVKYLKNEIRDHDASNNSDESVPNQEDYSNSDNTSYHYDTIDNRDTIRFKNNTGITNTQDTDDTIDTTSTNDTNDKFDNLDITCSQDTNDSHDTIDNPDNTNTQDSNDTNVTIDNHDTNSTQDTDDTNDTIDNLYNTNTQDNNDTNVTIDNHDTNSTQDTDDTNDTIGNLYNTNTQFWNTKFYTKDPYPGSDFITRGEYKTYYPLHNEVLYCQDLDMFKGVLAAYGDLTNSVDRFGETPVEKVRELQVKINKDKAILLINELYGDPKPLLKLIQTAPHDLSNYIFNPLSPTHAFVSSEDNLMTQFCFGTVKELRQLLLQGHAINSTTRTYPKNRSLLHVACAYTSLESMKYLIDEGFDVNRRDELGNTPLYYCCCFQSDSVQKFKLLISRNARYSDIDMIRILELAISRLGKESKLVKYLRKIFHAK